MLRKKITKEPPKAPENNNPKPTTPSNSNLPKPIMSSSKVDLTKAQPSINKDKIAQLVANKIRENKKQNEIINKISAQMQTNQKKKIQDYNGLLSTAIKLSSLQFVAYSGVSQQAKPLKLKLSKFATQNFKSADYI